MTTFVNHNNDNNTLSSPAYKVRKIVRGDQNYSNSKLSSTGTTYQSILKHSTGSRIIGIPKHIRLQMQRNKEEQKEKLAKKETEEEEDDKKPYNVSQTFHINDNPKRRMMPPHKPRHHQLPRHPLSPSISSSSSALTPSRNNPILNQRKLFAASSNNNRNKRTRTGLSPALRALGFNGNEDTNNNSRLRNKLPPAFNLDDHDENDGGGDDDDNDKRVFLGRHANTVNDSSSEEDEEENEEYLPDDDENALNPMMLNNSHHDSEDDDNDDGDEKEKEKDNEDGTDDDDNCITPSLSQSPTDDYDNNDDDTVGEKNENVSFLFRRSSVESTNDGGEDGDLSTSSMIRSTSWSHLISPMLSPSNGASLIASKPRTISATSFASAGDFYDEDDDTFGNDMDDGFVELDL